jgi:hypothetical protein
LANRILDYFALRSDVPELGSGGRGTESQAILFLGVVLGAVSKVIYQAIQAHGIIEWRSLIIALIASVVTFPYIYDHAGLRRGGLTLAKWCSAFQNGFFWSVAMAALSK